MLDRFGRRHVYLRLAVTEYCNLNCTYCKPQNVVSRGPRMAAMSAETIERLVSVFAGLGVLKVRLTGGEPTVRPDLLEIASRISHIPGIETLALTTNGVSLASLARPLREAGVEKMNVSLDSLRPDRFAAITGRDELDAVLRGIDAALAAGFSPLKLNVVVMRGVNDDEILDFVALGRDRAINIRFIEYMPFRENGWSRECLVPYEQMLDKVGRAHRLTEVDRGGRTGGVAKDFRLEGHRGQVSFITPVSDTFCERCNRLRVTASGHLKTCLFAATGVNLAEAAGNGASDEDLAGLILQSLAGKPERHPEAERLCDGQDRAMNQIGG